MVIPQYPTLTTTHGMRRGVQALKDTVVKRIADAFFGKDTGIGAQTYNLLMFTSIGAGIYGIIAAVTLSDSMLLVVFCAQLAVEGLVLLLAAVRTKKYRLFSWLYIVTVFLIMLPALFFTSGGYRSGAYLSFGAGIFFTAALLQKRGRIVALMLEIMLYVACMLVAYYKPDVTRSLPTEFDNLYSTLFYFLSVGVFLLVGVLACISMIRLKQEQVYELNQELVARNEALKRYDSMKSNFLATVAHEINTPLAVIAASSSDTLDLLGELPLRTDEIAENQIIIEKRVKLIDRILLDLMDTIALETGRLSLRRVPVSLAELLADICDAQNKKRDMGSKRAELVMESNLPSIWLDPARIEQVVMNLLSNAFKYTRSGVVTVKLAQTDGCQEVSVADDGEGMDAEAAQAALTQFATTKADHWRHGIGLYISRRIISAHNGEIWIDSEKGRGTTVTFALKETHGYDWT
jgi:signal transduction histidine kinase